MMLTRIGTLTINPAFLQDIKEDNVHLKQLLNAAKAAMCEESRSRIRPRMLSDLLSRLRDQLASHFALEEYFGYFEDAIEVAPHLSQEADLLRAQHDVLYLKVCELADDAEKLLYESSDSSKRMLAMQFEGFHKQLMEHEEREADLITQSLYVDFGGGD